MQSTGGTDILLQITPAVINDIFVRIWNQAPHLDPRSRSFLNQPSSQEGGDASAAFTLSRESPEIECGEHECLTAKVKFAVPIDSINRKCDLTATVAMSGPVAITSVLQGTPFLYLNIPTAKEPEVEAIHLEHVLDRISTPIKGLTLPVDKLPIHKLPFADKFPWVKNEIPIHEHAIALTEETQRLRPLIALWLLQPLCAMPLTYHVGSLPLLRADLTAGEQDNASIPIQATLFHVSTAADAPLVSVGYQLQSRPLHPGAITSALPSSSPCNAALTLTDAGLQRLLDQALSQGSLRGTFKSEWNKRAVSWRWEHFYVHCLADELHIGGDLMSDGTRSHIDHHFTCQLDESGELHLGGKEKSFTDDPLAPTVLYACTEALRSVLAVKATPFAGRKYLWQRFIIPTTLLSVTVAAREMAIAPGLFTLRYTIPPYSDTASEAPVIELTQVGAQERHFPQQQAPGALVTATAVVAYKKGTLPFAIVWKRGARVVGFAYISKAQPNRPHQFHGAPLATTGHTAQLTEVTAIAIDRQRRRTTATAPLMYQEPQPGTPRHWFPWHLGGMRWAWLVPLATVMMAALILLLGKSVFAKTSMVFTPRQISWDCTQAHDPLAARTITVDNTQSHQAGSWYMQLRESAAWATIDRPVGAVATTKSATVTLTPAPALCATLFQQGQTTPVIYHIDVLTSLSRTPHPGDAMQLTHLPMPHGNSKAKSSPITVIIVPPLPAIAFQVKANDTSRACNAQLETLSATGLTFDNSHSSIRVTWSVTLRDYAGQAWGRVPTAQGITDARATASPTVNFDPALCQHLVAKATHEPQTLHLTVTWQAMGSDHIPLDLPALARSQQQGSVDIPIVVTPAYAQIVTNQATLTFNCAQQFGSQSVTLDTTGSTVPITWSSVTFGMVLNRTWAQVDHATGSIEAGHQGTLVIVPDRAICQQLQYQGVLTHQPTGMTIHWQAGKIAVADIAIKIMINPPPPVLVFPDVAIAQTCSTTLPPQAISLDNSRNSLVVHWALQSIDQAPNNGKWAALATTTGIIGAGQRVSLSVTPSPTLCQSLYQNHAGTSNFHVHLTWTAFGSDGTHQIPYGGSRAVTISDTVSQPVVQPSAKNTTFNWVCGKTVTSQVTIDNTQSTVALTLAQPTLAWAKVVLGTPVVAAGRTANVTVTLVNSACGGSETSFSLNGTLPWSVNGLNANGQFTMTATIIYPLQPTVAITAPLGFDCISGPTVTFTANAKDMNTSTPLTGTNVIWYLGDTQFGTGASFTYNFLVNDHGSYNVKVVATGQYGVSAFTIYKLTLC